MPRGGQPHVVRHSVNTVNTVKAYLRSAYRKLGAQDRDQAVAAAFAHGLIDTP